VFADTDPSGWGDLLALPVVLIAVFVGGEVLRRIVKGIKETPKHLRTHRGLGTKETVNPESPDRWGRDKENIPQSLRIRVLRRDKSTCQYCGHGRPNTCQHCHRGLRGFQLQVDHKVPESLGGETVFDNLWVLCRECNLGKGDRYSDDRLNRQTHSVQATTYAANRSSGRNRRRGHEDKINTSLRVDVLKRDKHSCQKCGESAPEVALHVDCIVPISEGGKIAFDNLQVLCERHSVLSGPRPWRWRVGKVGQGDTDG
jgi:5-methylcytosine-specific restriction endonuclease McrA